MGDDIVPDPDGVDQRDRYTAADTAHLRFHPLIIQDRDHPHRYGEAHRSRSDGGRGDQSPRPRDGPWGGELELEPVEPALEHRRAARGGAYQGCTPAECGERRLRTLGIEILH